MFWQNVAIVIGAAVVVNVVVAAVVVNVVVAAVVVNVVVAVDLGVVKMTSHEQRHPTIRAVAPQTAT